MTDTIREQIWSGVIDEGGKLCGSIMITLNDRGGLMQYQVTAEELDSLARMFAETAAEVRRRQQRQEPA